MPHSRGAYISSASRQNGGLVDRRAGSQCAGDVEQSGWPRGIHSHTAAGLSGFRANARCDGPQLSAVKQSFGSSAKNTEISQLKSSAWYDGCCLPTSQFFVFSKTGVPGSLQRKPFHVALTRA